MVGVVMVFPLFLVVSLRPAESKLYGSAYSTLNNALKIKNLTKTTR
jgi:hypothetical protein